MLVQLHNICDSNHPQILCISSPFPITITSLGSYSIHTVVYLVVTYGDVQFTQLS